MRLQWQSTIVRRFPAMEQAELVRKGRALEEQAGRVLDGGIEWEWPMADGFGRRVVDLRWYEREEKKRGREPRDPRQGVVELMGGGASTAAAAHHVLHLLLLLPCHQNNT